ncbi:MAG TPA: protoglobin domain-containing protein [Kineosporiaceae bacterium]|nr:protoglobin domain-containing protein [Kineosporiaceae bacterium]
METMREVAHAAMNQIPPECRVRTRDAEIIQRYRDALLALEPDVIKGFYDTLYSHPATAAVFVDGERQAREGTLSNWWRRTVNGPLDEAYFTWMATVGLVHVVRRVSNPMMLSMAGYVASMVGEKVAEMQLDHAEAEALVEAFRRLSSTVGSIISFGYDRAYDKAVQMALFDLAGMPEALFQRLVTQEVNSALTRARSEGADHA